MSFSYDTALPTYKDKVRLLTFDVTQATAAFSDEEINAYESIEANIFLAAAEFCRIKGLKIAERAVLFDTSADVRGGLSIDRRNQPEWWFKRAETLEARAAADIDEVFTHVAFDVDRNGVDRSQYQGQTDYVDDL